MAVTIRDVAKKAGYSITTVSRALNGYDDVNEKTREKIFKVARELNYQPNRLAQNLVSKKANTLGLFVLERRTFLQPFVFEVISGIMDYVTQKNYDLLLFGLNSLKDEVSPAQICVQRGVGGAAIMGLRIDDPIIAKMKESNFPTVLIDIPVISQKATYIASNNFLGSFKAIEHLIKLGHRHIGFINGHSGAWVSFERLKGYKEGLKRSNLPIKEEYIYNGDFTKESGKHGIRKLLKNSSDITAIYAASDLMATGVIEELIEMGYSVPDDISVVGFDDLEFASYITPSLTTIRQNKYQMGYEMANQLIKMIEDPEYTPSPKLLDTELVIRNSTAPVKTE